MIDTTSTDLHIYAGSSRTIDASVTRIFSAHDTLKHFINLNINILDVQKFAQRSG